MARRPLEAHHPRHSAQLEWAAPASFGSLDPAELVRRLGRLASDLAGRAAGEPVVSVNLEHLQLLGEVQPGERLVATAASFGPSAGGWLTGRASSISTQPRSDISTVSKEGLHSMNSSTQGLGPAIAAIPTIDELVRLLPDHTPLEAVALGARLSALLEVAHAAWPAIRLDDADFVRFLAERLSSPCSAADLAKLHGSDLFLACACARGDTAALLRLDESFLSSLPRSLRRIESVARLHR